MEDGQTRSSADGALRILSEAPPLTTFAAVAALFELTLGRLAWHGLRYVVEPGDLRALHDLARFPRNLAAVAGLVALVVALFSFLRLPGWAPIVRRLAVAAFTGIFVPCMLVATVLPHAALRPRIVVFGLAAANVLVTLTGMTAVRYRPGAALRLATLLVAMTAFLSLTVVGLGQVMMAQHGPLAQLAAFFVRNADTSQRVLLGLRHLGELCWFGALVGGALAALHQRPRGRNTRYVVAALILALTFGLGLYGHSVIGHRFRLMMFGAFRFGLLLDEAPIAYCIPLGIGVGGALVALAHRSTGQLGLGLLLWIAAGYAPHTPIQLLYLVLAAMLITRSAQALDLRTGWQRHQPWAKLTRSRTGRDG